MKPRPAQIHPDNWDEEEGKEIKDVRTVGGVPPHRAKHFHTTIRSKVVTEAYREGWERIFGKSKN